MAAPWLAYTMGKRTVRVSVRLPLACFEKNSWSEWRDSDPRPILGKDVCYL